MVETGEREPEIENRAKLLVRGVFGPEEIEVQMTGRGMPENVELRERTEEIWAPKAARGWFPGPLVRVDSFELTPEGKLSLIVGKTDFEEYTGSRDLESLRKYGYEGISNPLSVSCALITADGKMLVAQRISGDAADSIDVIGGYVHPEKDFDDERGAVDIFKAARREVWEEAEVGPDEILEIWCLGLSYEYAGLCHPVASFLVKTSLTSGEVKERKSSEVDIITVEPERTPTSDSGHGYVMKLLRERYPHVEPDGRITIGLARRWLSGKQHEKKVVRTKDQI